MLAIILHFLKEEVCGQIGKLMEKMGKNNILTCLSVFFLMLMGAVSCQQKETFVGTSYEEVFVQKYRLSYLDMIWVMDDRSTVGPLYPVLHENILSQTQDLFRRLAQRALSYRMALINSDMEYTTQIRNDLPFILEGNQGSLEQKVQLFRQKISYLFNLNTSAENKGFESLLWTLKKKLFVPRSSSAVVILFIQEGDDHSFSQPPPSSSEIIPYMKSQIEALIPSSVIRVYSISYTPEGKRCGQSQPEIDREGFENRYFSLALFFQGKTADICEPFASTLSLEGLKQGKLQKRFLLRYRPRPTSLKVRVQKDGQTLNLSFSYDPSSNEIVFSSPPPEGAQITVSYRR